MSIIALDAQHDQPDAAATRTVINVLTREMRTFEDNARRNPDAASYHQQRRIITAFRTEIAHLEQQLAPRKQEAAA